MRFSLSRSGLLVLLALALAVPASVAAATLTTGFSSLPESPTWLSRAVSEQAGIVRVAVGWVGVAPATRPASFDAASPASPGYSFSGLDGEVEALSARGLRVMLTITAAPRWAEGPNMPRGAAPGSWRPDPAAFGQFARAIATRYDGRFPDPLHAGRTLPRVGIFQGWNEPNLSAYLSPQWTRHGKSLVATSPGLLRSLQNAFYAGVKAVQPSATVVLAGTAPYGDPPGGPRIPPVAFYRSLFCLSGSAALRPQTCPSPTYFDAADHHPYGVSSPTATALNPDDAAIPDVHKITRVIAAARRAGRALPRGPKPTWVTEYSWDSKPPDPHGVPIATQARWLEQAMYVLWRQGVGTILWLQIVDDPPVPSYASSYQAGLYYLNGDAKPSATAFRFPFVTQRLSASRVRVWSRAPAAGRLLVQVSTAHGWRTILSAGTGALQVLQRTVSLRGEHTLRAVLGGESSLSWTQR
jgi:hypothetical protein